MDRELLIEIGLEELPAAWLPGLTRQFGEHVEARLKDARIAPGAPVESYATPRRLTARLAKIAERQEDLEELVSGPPVSAAFGPDGQPTPAAVGFARKLGVTVEELGRTKSAKGEYLSFLKRQRGKSAIDALPAVLGAVLRDLAFPKQMKWDATLDDGRGEFVFGRPIRWLLFLYGGRVVPFTIGRAANAAGPLVQDVESGALTYGHRFLATSGRAGRSIKVRSFDEYEARLKEHFVVLEHSERRDRIARDLEGHARRLSGRVALKEHQRLLDEVADLVEYPGVVAGFYDAAFLALPEEVLSTTLVHHQHYFPVVSDRGELKEAFLAVVNTQPKDERLIAKNAERVVAARLRDARFFWESDRKSPLASRHERLHTVAFHKKLGSYRDKTERIEQLAAWIAGEVLGKPEAAGAAATAARLAKADLTTDMVFEFPELQGRMGGIYAREEGQPEPVWKAIYYHYLPIGVEADAPPSKEQLGAAAVTWAAISLADKVDTVLGLLRRGRESHRFARSVWYPAQRSGGDPDSDGCSRAHRRRSRNRSQRGALEGIRAIRRSSGGCGRCRPGTGILGGAHSLRPRAARVPGRDRACRHLGQPTSLHCGRGASPRRCSGCAPRRTSRRSPCCSSGSRTSPKSWPRCRHSTARRWSSLRSARCSTRSTRSGRASMSRRQGRITRAPSPRSPRCARPSIVFSPKYSSWPTTSA